MNIKESAKHLNVSFHDELLLEEALTHRSYINENKGAGNHNERLEFLGDAVLELVVTDFLYKKFPEKPEGELTAYRSALVNTISLSESAHALSVSDMLRLSKGEARDTGKARQIILANAFEAIIGALYLDGGYETARVFVEKHILPKLDTVLLHKTWQDAKSSFQEIAQEKRGITPLYKTLAQEGPDHAKVFTVGVFLGEEKIAEGKGNAKQEAEQEAARAALLKMN